MRQNLTGKYHLKISPTLRTHQNKFWGWRLWQSLSLLEFCLHWEGWLRGVFHSRYQHPSICNGLPLLIFFPLYKIYWLTTATSDCSHFLLLEPTQKAASCNNNCFCYMFSISCGHVGHDYSEFFVGRHVLDMIFFFFMKSMGLSCLSLIASYWFIGTLQGTSSESSGQLPFSTWAYLSTILFGIILVFYVDSIAEERYLI